MPKKKPPSLPFIVGEKGTNRVRLFAHPKTQGLYLEFRDRKSGRKVRVSVGTRDIELGKQAAEKLALELRATEAARPKDVTLRTLFDNYEREVTPTKSATTQEHDRRARKLFEQCWGADTKAKDLDRRDWDRFIHQRQTGSLKPDQTYREGGVGSRVIQYDLKFVLAVLNWAELVREGGRPLLERNPFKGFPLPAEESPSRPSVTEEEFQKLQQAAAKVGDLCPLYLLLTHETGHRCTAVGRLRWSDIDFGRGAVTWRAEFDKMGREHTVPLSACAVEALRVAQVERRVIGDAWVFPSPTDAARPVSRHLLRDWWQRLEKLSGIERIRGRGWHSLRRKFATEHQDLPPVELMALGGWKDYQTIVKCYQKPREESLRAALERRSRARAGGQ